MGLVCPHFSQIILMFTYPGLQRKSLWICVKVPKGEEKASTNQKRSFCMGILSLSLDFKWISHSQCIGVVYKALCRLVLGSAGRKVKQVGCGSLAVSPPHSSYLHHHHHILATTTSKPPPIKPHWSSHQHQHPFSVRFQKQLSTNVKKKCTVLLEQNWPITMHTI